MKCKRLYNLKSTSDKCFFLDNVDLDETDTDTGIVKLYEVGDDVVYNNAIVSDLFKHYDIFNTFVVIDYKDVLEETELNSEM